MELVNLFFRVAALFGQLFRKHFRVVGYSEGVTAVLRITHINTFCEGMHDLVDELLIFLLLFKKGFVAFLKMIPDSIRNKCDYDAHGNYPEPEAFISRIFFVDRQSHGSFNLARLVVDNIEMEYVFSTVKVGINYGFEILFCGIYRFLVKAV